METTQNYQLLQIMATQNQTLIIDRALTNETDELNPLFQQIGSVLGPEDDPEDPEDDDELFPTGEDLERDNDDPDLNHDEDDDLSLNIDDDEPY